LFSGDHQFHCSLWMELIDGFGLKCFFEDLFCCFILLSQDH
jgi:hypothetical protein